MNIIDFDDMRFGGKVGESVSVSVEPTDTVQLVTYTLNGSTHALKAGETIRFTLAKSADGGPTFLQMNFDFTNDNGASYRVGLRSVDGEPDNECVYAVDGPPLAIRNFRIFVS